MPSAVIGGSGRTTKHLFVTGGVASSLGKGLTASSLGRLLKSRGLRVTMQKLDPYLNVDPGTMNPFQHGEVFVTDDGAETDLDVGHYERFLDTASSGVLVAGPASASQPGGFVEALRGDDLAGTVSTIDVSDSPSGRIVAALALAQEAGGDAGAWGTSRSADGAVPSDDS